MAVRRGSGASIEGAGCSLARASASSILARLTGDIIASSRLVSAANAIGYRPARFQQLGEGERGGGGPGKVPPHPAPPHALGQTLVGGD